MKSGLTKNEVENRIIKDLLIGIGAIVILAWAPHFLDLSGTLAEWTNRPELKETDPIVMVVLFNAGTRTCLTNSL